MTGLLPPAYTLAVPGGLPPFFLTTVLRGLLGKVGDMDFGFRAGRVWRAAALAAALVLMGTGVCRAGAIAAVCSECPNSSSPLRVATIQVNAADNNCRYTANGLPDPSIAQCYDASVPGVYRLTLLGGCYSTFNGQAHYLNRVDYGIATGNCAAFTPTQDLGALQTSLNTVPDCSLLYNNGSTSGSVCLKVTRPEVIWLAVLGGACTHESGIVTVGIDLMCQTTPSPTPTFTRTPTPTASPTPLNPADYCLDLKVWNPGQTRDGYNLAARITNYGSKPLPIGHLTVKAWFNQRGIFAGGRPNPRDNFLFTPGRFRRIRIPSTRTTVSRIHHVSCGPDRKAHHVAVIHLPSGPGLVLAPNGGYLQTLGHHDTLGSWTSLFRFGGTGSRNQDYSNIGLLGGSAAQMEDDPHFALYLDGQLVCECIQGQEDPLSGQEPCGINACPKSPTPSSTLTSTPSFSPSPTPSATATDSATFTDSATATPSATATDTPTQSPTDTPSPTPTQSPTATQSVTAGPSATPLPPCAQCGPSSTPVQLQAAQFNLDGVHQCSAPQGPGLPLLGQVEGYFASRPGVYRLRVVSGCWSPFPDRHEVTNNVNYGFGSGTAAAMTALSPAAGYVGDGSAVQNQFLPDTGTACDSLYAAGGPNASACIDVDSPRWIWAGLLDPNCGDNSGSVQVDLDFLCPFDTPTPTATPSTVETPTATGTATAPPTDTPAPTLSPTQEVPSCGAVQGYALLGQSSWSGQTPSQPPTASSLDSPWGVFAEGQRPIVADTGDNRVLVYPGYAAYSSPPYVDPPASLVLGQPGFTTSAVQPLSASSLDAPRSAILAGGSLFVADTGDNRVLVYPTLPAVNGAPAGLVLGQPDLASGLPNRGGAVSALGMSAPSGLASDGSHLYVADTGDNRVLVFDLPITSDDPAPALVLGQPGFGSGLANQGGAAGASTLSGPTGLYVYGNMLMVADTGNNRVLAFSLPLSGDGQAAGLVLGQAGFSGSLPNRGGAAAAGTLDAPTGVARDGSYLYVADTGNNRVAYFLPGGLTNGEDAQLELGQPGAAGTAPNGGTAPNSISFYQPHGLWIDGSTGYVWVADSSNHRAMGMGCIDLGFGAARAAGLDRGAETPAWTPTPALRGSLEAVPNPAHGGATAFYRMDQPGRARLMVFDLQGGPVLSLDLGDQSAGVHRAELPLQGKASGLYFLVLQRDAGLGWTNLAVFKLALVN